MLPLSLQNVCFPKSCDESIPIPTMADSKAPPSAAASSNPLPEPKRVRTSFPDTQAGDQRSPPRHSIGATESQAPGIATTASAIPTEPLPEDGEIEAVSEVQQGTRYQLT